MKDIFSSNWQTTKIYAHKPIYGAFWITWSIYLSLTAYLDDLNYYQLTNSLTAKASLEE